jgi:uracil-DNA glycosylase family 4
MSDRRNAVFLEEMGVGPQWRLRNRPASADAYAGVDAGPEEAFAPAAEAAAMPVSAPAAPMAPAPMQAYAPAAPMPPAAAQAAPVNASVPAAPQSPAAAAAASARAAAPVPGQADDAPPAAPATPAAPVRVPGTPSIASTGEDMSWFDDAPTPEYKPQRKKVAAPEQPAAAQPPRPAAAAQAMSPARQPMPQRAASAPPPVMADDMPMDDIPMEEPPSWFDDDQPAAPAAARSEAPAPGRTSDEEIARMDWPTLQAAVANCTRCGRCETRQQAIPGRGDEQATWIALDTAPGQAEDAEGYQFAGDTGYLLDNMLKAVGQTTEKGAYLTSLVKCHAPHAPSAEELLACRPYLQRELELTQAKVIVAFGHTTGKGLLGAAARGRIMLHGSVPVVATYHPADLLKKPEEKAKAWQDLCLAKAAHAGRR